MFDSLMVAGKLLSVEIDCNGCSASQAVSFADLQYLPVISRKHEMKGLLNFKGFGHLQD